MSDLISRQEALDTFVKYVADGFAESENDFDAYMNIIKEISSAQPEIIYCEDCKYYMPQREHTGLCTWFSDVLKYGVGYNDYCSNAEKDGDTDERKDTDHL